MLTLLHLTYLNGFGGSGPRGGTKEKRGEQPLNVITYGIPLCLPYFTLLTRMDLDELAQVWALKNKDRRAAVDRCTISRYAYLTLLTLLYFTYILTRMDLGELHEALAVKNRERRAAVDCCAISLCLPYLLYFTYLPEWIWTNCTKCWPLRTKSDEQPLTCAL